MVSLTEKSAGFENVLVTLEDHVATITLNRPHRRNALNYPAYDELEQSLRAAAADPDVRCVIVTGADPAFCSGDDVGEIMAGPKPVSRAPMPVTFTATPAAMAALECDKPIIAAVNGAAVGWGMELAVMADIRIASEKARFGELFIKRGLCCDVPGIGRLASLVGRERAAELLFTGRIIDAAEAKEFRLVSRVVPHDELMPAAIELATQVASNPPLAVAKLKEGLRKALDPDWDDLGRWVSTSLAALFQTEDHREGVASFLEKREPNYVGR
jgi:enoyl-CoA hydratase/carnithine racemase